MSGAFGPSMFWNGGYPADADIYNSGKGYTCSSLPTALRTNLVACWDLDEASGTRANESYTSCGSACDLTAVNAPGRTAGLVETGMGMSERNDGTAGQYLVTSGAPQAATKEFTANVWLMPYSNGAGATLIGRYSGATSASGWTVFDNNNGYIYSLSVIGGVQTISDGVARTNNQWAMWTAKREAGSSKGVCLYKNGVATGVCTANDDINLATAEFYIGNNPAGGKINGVFDGAGYWNRELTPTEIPALYAAGAGVEYPWSSILALLHLDAPDERWASMTLNEKQLVLWHRYRVFVPSYMIPSHAMEN
jgi:hypothetical protein